ncbi:MAG: HEPN domain-containing protein [Candidatus Woesearchaeota archaeon]
MKEYDLLELIENKEKLQSKIKEYLKKQKLFKQKIDDEEIKGHLDKSLHNLKFILLVLDKEFYDWALTGCYYACYHAALALIQTRGYTSKNHYATICVIIKEFYKKQITKQDVELISNVLDYQDLLFYVQTKTKREQATYTTKTIFNKKEIEKLRIQTVLFVNKVQDIILIND